MTVIDKNMNGTCKIELAMLIKETQPQPTSNNSRLWNKYKRNYTNLSQYSRGQFLETYLNDKEEKAKETKEEPKKKKEEETKEEPKKKKEEETKEDPTKKEKDEKLDIKDKKPSKPKRKFLFLKGGEFLLKNIENEDMFIPEEFSEDVHEITAMVTKFV